MAIAVGADPLCTVVATNAYRIGEDEADFAGALRQQPVELVKCETSDLLVPAHSEMIIEGEALPDVTAPEGPFGEYPGYRTQGANYGVLCRVKAITYRNFPINSMISLGMPVDDNAVVRRLIRHGLPITDVYAPPEGVCHLVIVSVKSGGREVAREILNVMTERRTRVTRLIVVDDDVDVFNLGQVLHAYSTKCHPARGTILAEFEGRVQALTPAYSREERRRVYSATALSDCTWPSEWSPETDIPVKSSFGMMYPEELKQKVIANWSQYGFK
jgi:4-hydroxy-3-polyprenylbenzoate decarboxylase